MRRYRAARLATVLATMGALSLATADSNPPRRRKPPSDTDFAPDAKVDPSTIDLVSMPKSKRARRRKHG